MIFSMRRTLTITLGSLAVSAVLLAGCSSAADTAVAPPAGAATEQVAGVQKVGPEEFDAAIKQGATVIDVRTPAEFSSGHLEGAVNIDIASPDFAAQIAELDPKKTYAVYCRSGNRSGVATTQMQNDGFVSLYDLQGGIGAWQSAGFPVV